ncbi:MAG: hypothetical protein KGM15_12020 [Pseudomonadota bacterium]|nr:hypothetical protein [Pseudomonadota bacterium]
MARRKAIYEVMYPETKAEANTSLARKASANSAFVPATVDATGKSRRSVEIAAARGKALGDDLDAIAGTSLDKGAELDALAHMDKEDRASLIQRAKTGEKVSARISTIDGDIKRARTHESSSASSAICSFRKSAFA